MWMGLGVSIRLSNLQEVVRSARTPDSALGTVFKKHLEEALLTRAKAPEECEAAGWALWGNLTKVRE